MSTHVTSKALVIEPELADSKFYDSSDRSKFSYMMSEGALGIRTRPDLDKYRTHYTLGIVELLWRVRKLTISTVLALPERVKDAKNSLAHSLAKIGTLSEIGDAGKHAFRVDM